MSPKPEIECGCVNGLCAEKRDVPELEWPPCGIQTDVRNFIFNWKPAGNSIHAFLIGRYGIGSSSEKEWPETMPGEFNPSEPLGDGEYYWKVKAEDGNWSPECGLTISRDKIICGDVKNEMEECWRQNSETIKDGEMAYCGDLLGYENACSEAELLELLEGNNRFAPSSYNQCNRLAVFYNRSENYKPVDDFYNRVIAECYG